MKKKIIFGAPLTDGPATDIIKNLEYCRFEVIDITINQNFKYKKFGDRVINFGKKVFLNDNSYKKKLRFDLYRSHITKNLEALENADFGLIIRPDIYPINFLKKIKKKCSHLVGYQWDGMNRFKEIKNYVSVFDEFFVFDPDDSDEKHSPVTNFYFDFDIENNQNVKENNQIYFLGTYLKPRLKDLEELIGPIKKNNLIPKIIIYNPKKRKINNPDIISIDSPISFEKNILLQENPKS